jgi:hypothetical protein
VKTSVDGLGRRSVLGLAAAAAGAGRALAARPDGQNRDGQNRDGQNRDGQNCDGQNRDGALAFTKGLPKDDVGVVRPAAYRSLVEAIRGRDPAALAEVPFAGPPAAPLIDPAGGFDLPITRHRRASDFSMPAPPGPLSAPTAAETVELYWAALLRDVPFEDFARSAPAGAAAAELAGLPGYAGPRRPDGSCPPGSLLRPRLPAARRGGFISQFLLLDVPTGALVTAQRVPAPVVPQDWLTSEPDWLAAQGGPGGLQPQPQPQPQPPAGSDRRSYLVTPRQLATCVFRDHPVQPFLHAALILDGAGLAPTATLPYAGSANQRGYITYGQPHLLSLLAQAADRALRAAWYAKWAVYRRIRPEELGGRVQAELTGRGSYGLPAELLGSTAVRQVRDRFGTALLPQAYPAGCPGHPSYPSGHATVAGACGAVLKAWYPRGLMPTAAVVPTPDGQALTESGQQPTTVTDEIDKLTANVGAGRSIAGVHYRSDNTQGFRLGEQVALALLAEDRRAMPETCPPYRVRCLDGAVRPA